MDLQGELQGIIKCRYVESQSQIETHINNPSIENWVQYFSSLDDEYKTDFIKALLQQTWVVEILARNDFVYVRTILDALTGSS